MSTREKPSYLKPNRDSMETYRGPIGKAFYPKMRGHMSLLDAKNDQ